jgi:hypothetical protein
MEDTNNPLAQAIEDAVAKHPPTEEIKETEKEKEVEKKEKEGEVDKSKEEEAPVEVEATQEEIANALQILRALENPDSRAKLIESMAKNAGYDLTKKAEQKALIRDTKQILREKLGESYDLLSGDGLSAALDELVEQKVKDLTKPVLDEFSRAQQTENERKGNQAMDDFFKRNNIISKEDREKTAAGMLKKMEIMPATKTTPIDEYLDDIYLLVNKGKSEARTVAKTVEKITRNANERHSSGEGTGNDDRIKTGSHRPSLDEAVRAAFEGKKLE